MTTVREFVEESYQLISAQSPTVPLHGNDLQKGIKTMNRLLNAYAANGLYLTIAKEVTIPLAVGQREVVCGPANFLPVPDITIGRLANVENAWLTLSGVTYPLIYQSKPNFNSAWKFEPLEGLPRFLIAFPDTKVVRLRLYPAPSQIFDFTIRGKFQATNVTSNDTIDSFPDYYERFLTFAVSRDLGFFKARGAAWSKELEELYKEARADMEGASEINVAINGDEESLLNGSWRVRAGI